MTTIEGIGIYYTGTTVLRLKNFVFNGGEYAVYWFSSLNEFSIVDNHGQDIASPQLRLPIINHLLAPLTSALPST